MSKKKLFFFLFFSLNFILNLSGQKNKSDFEKYQLKNKISVEDYLWSGGDFPLPSEIVGLFQFDNSTLFWISLSGEITFYDTDLQKILIHYSIFNDLIITKASFNQVTKKLFLCEKGKIISVFNLRNKGLVLKTSLIDVSLQDTVTFNDLAISPSGSSVLTFSNNNVFSWQFNNGVWRKKKFQTSRSPFSIGFLNDSIFLVGSHDGYGQLYNIENLKLIKSVKMFDAELVQCAVSKDRLKFAVTDQKIVKVYERNLGYPRKIKPNFEFIGNIEWLDNKHILVTGNGPGFEVWNYSKNRPPKLLVSKNVSKQKTIRSKKKGVFPKRTSYLILSTIDSIISLKKFNSSLTAIDVDENYLATAEENFDLKMFQINENGFNLNEVMNCQDHIGKSISDIQIRDSKSVYVGSLDSGGSFDFGNKDVHPFLTYNYWFSFNQIDFKSFHDVKIFKSDNGFEDRKISSITFDPYIDSGKRLSDLNKKIRKEGIKMRILRNPAGFDISPEKKFLLSFDADGYMEILNIKTYEIIFNDRITSFPIVFSGFLNEEEIIAVDTSGNIFKHKVKNGNELTLIKKENLGIKPIKAAINGLNLLMMADSQRITIYNLNNSEIVSIIENKYKNFNIDQIVFIPKSEKFIYTLNEKGIVKIDRGNNAVVLNNTNNRTSSVGITNHSILTNQNILVLGNSFGDLFFYEKK